MEAMHRALTPLHISAAASSRSGGHASGASMPVASLPWRRYASGGSAAAGGEQSFAAMARRQVGRGRRSAVVMLKESADAYACAVMEIGNEKRILQTLSADVKKLGTLLEDPLLVEFLRIPVIQDEKKKAVLKALAMEAEFQPYIANLLLLLVDQRSLHLLPGIVKEFEDMYNQITDTEVAIVTSAIKLDDSQLGRIGKKVQSLTGSKNVSMKNVIDPSVIAGFTVSYGKGRSRLIDLSVRGQIARIAQKINVSERLGFA